MAQDTYLDPMGDETGDLDEDETILYGDDPWSERRRQATIAMVLATAVFLVSLVVLAAYLGASDALLRVVDFWSFGVWIGVFSVLLIGFLVWLLVLLLTTPAGAEEDWYDEEADLEEADEDEVVGIPETIALRCPRCTNVFNLQDTGERPLRHTCPHCGATGSFDS